MKKQKKSSIIGICQNNINSKKLSSASIFKSSVNNNNIMNNKLQNGITLIALVISIIVMLILAGVSINAIVGDNGILGRTQLATIMTRFAGYKEQLELNAFDDDGVYASGENVKNYIPTITDEDVEKFVIMKRQLMYIENNELEIEAAQGVGIQTASTGEEGSASAIEEVKSVISGVVDLGSKDGESFEVPADDSIETIETNDNSKGLIGTRLFDRNGQNLLNKTWNIVIEYNNSNQEVARYGSGFYWLKAGETYIIDGKAKKFENDFIVDYTNKQYTVLSGRAVNWNFYRTVPITDGLIFSLDPSSLSEGEWIASTDQEGAKEFITKNGTSTGIYKMGDVEWNSSTNTLDFNYKNADEPTLMDGYLYTYGTTEKSLENGFTYIVVGKVNPPTKPSLTGAIGFGLTYLHPKSGVGWAQGGRFLCSDITYSTGYLGDWASTGNTTRTYFDNNKGFYEGNSDVFLNMKFSDVWDANDFQFGVVMDRNEKVTGSNDAEGDIYSRYSFFSKGECIANLGYKDADYEVGLSNWNKQGTQWDIGRCPHNNGQYEYLCGNFYSVLLYNRPLTNEEVKTVTAGVIKYVNSFLK